ncbi:mannosyltransferase putative-domain-containing protein [Scheffersomyces xylosifermentans]|uniref:mannosyltransferase putative-domain-containing protein n=1 Tax=Scheffersomyces xylosifermentans TaxID=1304137 RepID=UPI00315C89F5
MIKISKILLLVGAIITTINLSYVIHNYIHDTTKTSFVHHISKTAQKTMESLSRATKSQGSSTTDDYSLVGYHHNSFNNFMVIEKHFKTFIKDDTDVTQVWSFVNTDFASGKLKYDIKFINGYNYQDLIATTTEFTLEKLNGSYVEKFDSERKFIDAFKKFFDELFTLIEDCDPGFDGINDDEHYKKSLEANKYPHLNGRMDLYGGHLRENYLVEPIRTKEMLESFLEVSEYEVAQLKRSHEAFLSKMPTDWPSELTYFNKFNRFMKGDGIVYLGGGEYYQLAFLSIKTLRSNGSKLPVEVIIPTPEEYDVDFCNKLLPMLSGECKLMTDFLPDSIMHNITGYQLKNVALLISSFERILYLDADNIPIKNPDAFFNNKPFINKHLVLWPDLWRRSTSPSFYDIAGIKVDYKNRVRNSYFRGDARGALVDHTKYSMHDCQGAIPEASSETGQMLINKRVHFKTLILSMYYNFYGPNYYYPLLSQGAAGEGDKETFIAAAHKLDLPYYQVKEFNREFGPPNEYNQHQFYGMGQYDPIVDYIQSNEDVEDVGDEIVDYYSTDKPTYAKHNEDTVINNYHYHVFKASSLFFLHANWPKWLLEEVFIENYHGRGPFDGDELRRRLYGKDMPKELGGYDFELVIMKNLRWCFCEVTQFRMTDVPDFGTPERTKICEQIEEQLQYLKENKP